MTFSSRKTLVTPAARDDEAPGFPWLECGLALGGLALFLQIFPGVWWGLLAAIDVRAWTWRAYSLVSAVVIVILVGLKAWQNQ